MRRKRQNIYTKRNRYRYRKRIRRFLGRTLILLLCLLAGYGGIDYYQHKNLNQTRRLLVDLYGKISGRSEVNGSVSYLPEHIPPYAGQPYVILNDNIPDFNEEERTSGAFEYYSELDKLGRCGMAEAMLTRELMPDTEREEIGMIRPTGWHTVKYDIISDRYLYNRCHLIAFGLAGENANEKNLITGTRYMNVTGMLPWENKVIQYIRQTNGKVLYRVTPVFIGNELVARGVHMEAESIGSREIQFNIFVYNIQPGIGIDYATGESWLE